MSLGVAGDALGAALTSVLQRSARVEAAALGALLVVVTGWAVRRWLRQRASGRPPGPP